MHEIRMECLIAMQRYSECMGVIEKEVSEDESNPDLFIVRAQMNLLFGQVRLYSIERCYMIIMLDLQTSSGYNDVCRALALNPDHVEALEMKEDLERKAKQCKDQVSINASIQASITD